MPVVSRRSAASAVLVAALVSTACASAGSGTGGTSRSSTSDITPEEIGSRATLDLYTLVQQLRPNWLRTRGQSTPAGGLRAVQVAIDGRLQPGGLDVLRTLRGNEVTRIHFLGGQDATTRYGLDVEAGVIEVTTGSRGG